jgi:hypothetical protein
MELMIAITLLSMISVGMLFALRIGLNAYSKAQGHLMDNRRVAGAQRILHDQLGGMVPLMAPCGAGADGGGSKAPFFQGQPMSMRLISTFSLQGGWRGQMQILEIFVIPGDNAGVRLVVNEIPYAHPNQAGGLCTGPGQFLAVAATPKSFVLADKLGLCRFSYLSQPDDPTVKPEWGTTFKSRRWPLAVRIEMTPIEADFSRLQPITVTVPLRISRTPEILYDDRP